MPLLFQEMLSAVGMKDVTGWWSALDTPARGEAMQLWESCSQPGGHSVQLVVEAQFMRDDQADMSDGIWHSDFYEYLINHEIYLLEVKGGHICTAHPLARTALQRGMIARDFSCPLASSECPMHRLLRHSPGKNVRLRLRFPAAFRPSAESRS